jgi:hypothetical protein
MAIWKSTPGSSMVRETMIIGAAAIQRWVRGALNVARLMPRSLERCDAQRAPQGLPKLIFADKAIGTHNNREWNRKAYMRFKTLVLAAFTFGALAGCGQSDQENDSAPAKAPAQAPAPAKSAAASAPASSTPLPPYPAWAVSLIGTDTRSHYTVGDQCIGNFDGVVLRHTGPNAGVEAVGWGWNKDVKSAPDKVVFVDGGGKIVGAANTTEIRPDVPAAIPAITTPKVGWRGVIGLKSGPIRVMALTPGGKLCLIGSKIL